MSLRLMPCKALWKKDIVKRNLILQGAPGTGPNLSREALAYARIGQKNRDQLRSVPFHPNFSYADFVRGRRSVGNGHGYS